jgi:hypothetical protein
MLMWILAIGFIIVLVVLFVVMVEKGITASDLVDLTANATKQALNKTKHVIG